MRRIGLLAALMLVAVPGLAAAQDEAQRIAWNRPQAPFRVIGNVWYVGTEGLAAYLVTGPKGHVLVDAALPESAPSIAANVAKAGFRMRDVKVIALNHAHYDHAGGLAALKRLSGAVLAVGAGDADDVQAGRTISRPKLAPFPVAKVERRVADGDVVAVGPVKLTAVATPGHTDGCTSWTTRAAGKTVLFACSLTVAGRPLSEAAVAQFRGTFARLHGMDADVFLAFHPEAFGMAEKRARQVAGDAAAFVDRGELARRVDAAEQAFQEAVLGMGK